MASKYHNGWGLTPHTTVYFEQGVPQYYKEKTLLQRLSELMDNCYLK